MNYDITILAGVVAMTFEHKSNIVWRNEPDEREYARAFEISKTNPQLSLKLMEQLSSKGSMAAKLFLAASYRDPQFEVNRDKEKHWYLQAANSGNINAMNAYGGMCLSDGQFGNAISAFENAAKYENQVANYWLASMYVKGLGVPQDINAAVQFYLKSSNAGNGFATRELALLYLSGKLGKRQLIRSFVLFLKIPRQLFTTEI
jgi:TPR repeat protein